MIDDIPQAVTGWASIIPPDWTADKYPEVRIALFTSSHEAWPYPEMYNAARELSGRLASHPIYAASINVPEGQVIESPHAAIYYNADGPQLYSTFLQRPIKPGNYLAVFSPTLPKPEGQSSIEADYAILAFVGALSALMGQSVAHYRAHDFSIETSTGYASFTSPLIRMATPPQEFAYCEPAVVQSVTTLIASAVEPLPHMSLAFSLLGRATQSVDQSLRFFDFWAAFEVAAGGGGRPTQMIKAAPEGSYWRVEMTKLRDARNDLIHEGKAPIFTPEHEWLLAMSVMRLVFGSQGIVSPQIEALVNADHSAPVVPE